MNNSSDQITLVILGGLMSIFNGSLMILINAVFLFWLKRDELEYQHKLDLIAKQRELLLEHKLEMQRLQFNKHNK